MAKAAKKAKGEDADDDDDDFDKAAAMSKLQKAFGEMEKMKTFMKTATAQLEKLARSGERGQETADSEAHYRVPDGVTDMSPDAMATMGPGGSGKGGMPPENMSTTTFPGKAAGNFVTKEHADLLVKTAKLEGEVEALRRLPATVAGGRRPMSFDMSRVVGGGQDMEAKSKNEALFKGVDMNALSRGDADDPNWRSATGTVIGNMLLSGKFGKSMVDSDFHGTAGLGKNQ
jgi:hypothetical protein